jgi:hypothetical protein
MADEKVFADGFIFKRNDNAPDFVVGNVSVKVDDAIAFLKSNQKKGWVNLNIKRSQGGKYYTELDTWQPKGDNQGGSNATQAAASVGEQNDDLPF